MIDDTSTEDFDNTKKHPCLVKGCKMSADPYQDYCIKHLEMVIS